MPLSIAVVCEAQADCEVACGLADRVFCHEVDWISAEVLSDYRQWRGHEPYEAYLMWREVGERARRANIKAHGHFEGQPGAPDAHVARRALLLLKASAHAPDAVVLVRDDDRETERRKGLEQARKASKLSVPVVIGLAHTKRECWILNGFEPACPDEQIRLDRLCHELGFDPRLAAEQLTAKHPEARKNAKRVLRALTGGSAVPEARCWQQTPLTLLEQRGLNTGLASYLQEVREY